MAQPVGDTSAGPRSREEPTWTPGSRPGTQPLWALSTADVQGPRPATNDAGHGACVVYSMWFLTREKDRRESASLPSGSSTDEERACCPMRYDG